MPTLVPVVLAGWLALSVALGVTLMVLSRRAARRRPPCVVVDLQAVAMERARRGAARGQKRDNEGGSR